MINPNFHNKAARMVFEQLIAEGVDPEEMIQACQVYALEISSSGSHPLPMEVWLRNKPWESRRS